MLAFKTEIQPEQVYWNNIF